MFENQPAPGVNFIDNPLAPDVFADGASGFFMLSGLVRITLESARPNHSTPPGLLNRVVIARLVLPVPAAEELAKGLLDFLQRQKGQQAGAVHGRTTMQ
jgi:hypothetical protein